MMIKSISQFLILFLCLTIIVACGGNNAEEKTESKTEENTAEKKQIEESTPEETEDKEEALFTEFDWKKIPVTSKDIGAFPFVTAPEGMKITKKGSSKESETGYTKLDEFSKLNSYDGNAFFVTEGKRADVRFYMKDRKASFNKILYDRNIKQHMENLGAQLIFAGKVPAEKRTALKAIGKDEVFQYTASGAMDDNLRVYVIHHDSGKIVFQVTSNSVVGHVDVMVLEGFKQTMKTPTASEMKTEMDKTGKAILHINFDTNKATLKSDGQKVVDEIGNLLNQNSDLSISIEGHTDNSGSAERNQELSTQRAQTVMYALAAKGIDIARMKAVGFGASKPLVNNDTKENMAKNRRVELVKQ